MSTQKVVIVGASHAGAQCALSLRQQGHSGPITLISDEAHLPYHRPPLSKVYLSGEKTLDDILLRPAQTYADADIDIRLSTRIDAIDRKQSTVTTTLGDMIAFDKLVLATGARVRRLPIPGADNDKVFYLRNAADVERIKAAVSNTRQAVIIGGGYIGLETAASLHKQGIEVTVLEAMDRILQRVTAPVMSDFYRRVHQEEGVVIAESEMAQSIEGSSEGLTVKTASGNSYPADIVIIGIGVIPNSELASEAGLRVGNGIEVNDFCQTTDPHIYAIGDVTWHHSAYYDTHLRLESVPNATEQAKTVALHITDAPKPYKSLPWFWSDQFDLKLQIAGLSKGYDDIVMRGDAENGRSFSAFYFKGDQFLAVDSVNDPRAFMFSKMALSNGKGVDKAKLADPDTDLKAAIIP